MVRRRDGSIVSANLPSRGQVSAYDVERDYKIYRCMITAVNYVDSADNLTFDNVQVTYDAIILGGRQDGQEITNIKNTNMFGGQFNYHERIYRKTLTKFDDSEGKILAEQTGDIVYVGFVNGMTSSPIIIGCGTQPLDKNTTGATIADGPIHAQEYNGVYEKINKLGEYEFVRKGGTYNQEEDFFLPADRAEEQGQPAPEELFQARLKFSDNVMLWEDPKSSIEFKKNEVLWTHIVGKENTTYKETIDGTAEKTTRVYTSGLTITEDGAGDKVTFSLASGTLIDVDGAGGVVTIDADGGTNQIVIDSAGTITIKASSKVNIEAPLVDVGEGAAFSSTLFENLLSEFAKHTHIAPQAPAGALPTTPPVAPLISLVGSQSVKVKD